MSKEVKVKIYVVPINKLVHHESNPRKISRKRHKALIKSLTDFPEMKELREVVVDENMVILAGDKRTYALEEMGYEDVKVKQVFGLTKKQKREFMAKDNDHNGDWDGNIIARDWDTEELKDWGIKDFKIPTDPDEPKPEKKYEPHDVTCPNCGFHFELSQSASDED